MQKRLTAVLCGKLVFILLIHFSIACLAQPHIGTERTPPKRSTYKTAVWPIKFALELPIQVLRYTSEGIIIGIDESGIIPKYREIFFNEAETIGIYPMPSLSPSSGLGAGLVFFYDDFLRPGMDLEVETNLTSTSEQEAELSLRRPKWMNGRFYTNLLVKYDYDPDRDFYGIGFDSDKDKRTNFSLRTFNPKVDVGTNLAPTVQVGLSLGYLWVDNGPGKSQQHQSIEEVFEASQRPAFNESLSFFVPQFSLVHDNTKPKGRPHWGGREECTVALYNELTGEKFRLIHWKLQFSRYFHLFLDRTIAVRLQMRMNSSMGGGYEVPFFLRNQLGGDDTLRGYNTGRFADKDSILGTLEYRFPVWRHPSVIPTHQLDGRIFMDVGRVFNDIFDDFTFKDTKLCGGFGLRLSTKEEFIFRLEIAKSSEQLSVMFEQRIVF